MSFQNGIIGFGGLVVQCVVNGFGFMFVAGFTTTNKLYGILELVAVALGYSMVTFTGQNLGAKKYDRIRIWMISGIVELCMRISVALFLPLLIGETGIYFAEVAA
ncbi:MATE family efflux transporter [Clostridium chromiireducens]|uniref:MATE family efflux transporter n=1 Tax=Clostridium chromiireducens TaxID=225345 RepID=UPI00311AB13F